jgi:hypothetical protein
MNPLGIFSDQSASLTSDQGTNSETSLKTTPPVVDAKASDIGLQSIGKGDKSSDTIPQKKKSRLCATNQSSPKMSFFSSKRADADSFLKKPLFFKTDEPSKSSGIKRTLSQSSQEDSLAESLRGRDQYYSVAVDSQASSATFGASPLESGLSSKSLYQCSSPRIRAQRMTRAPISRPAWLDKHLTLWAESAQLSVIMINGKQYHIIPLSDGKGEFHKVFEFAEKTSIQVGDRVLSTDKLVLKILNSATVGPNKVKEVIQGDSAGYESLLANGVPLAEVYVDPINFVDSVDPKNGMFWLVEKMPVRITGEAWSGSVEVNELDSESKRILTWAKEWLTNMANSKTDLINDFRRRNTMCDEEGNIKVIDYSEPEKEEWDIKYGICRYAIDWANGNPKIKDWLTDQFPSEFSDSLLKSLHAAADND